MNTINTGVSSQTPNAASVAGTEQNHAYSSRLAENQSQTVRDSKLTELEKTQQVEQTQPLTPAEEAQQAEPLSPEQLEKVAQQLQDFVGQMNKSLQFNVHEESGRDVIQVVDRKSGDLIKQYPSEEVLDLVAKLSQATGSLIDEQI